MSTIAVNAITDASGGSAASINGYTPSASNMTGRNRLINSAMMIDQRNAGASSNPDNTYGIDRWYGRQVGGGVFSMQQSSTAPAGFQNSMALTVTTADSSLVTTDRYVVQQRIEGYNVADLDWGTSDAKTITVSFWARSSITGNHSISVKNQASNRIYATTYAIASADTWEYKTVTIAGDQSGTWEKTTSIGIALTFGLGGGPTYTVPANDAWTAGDYLFATGAVNLISTSSATLYITGVQLEVGSSASEFEHRQYGQELALCKRYYEHTYAAGTAAGTGTEVGWAWIGTNVSNLTTTVTFQSQELRFEVQKRSAPSITTWDSAGNSGKADRYRVGTGTTNNQTCTTDVTTTNSFRVFVQGTATATNGAFHWAANAEL